MPSRSRPRIGVAFERRDRRRRAGPQPRGSSPSGTVGGAPCRRAHRPHRRRPGRDRSDQPPPRRRGERAGGDATRSAPSHCSRSVAPRPRRCAPRSGSTRRSTRATPTAGSSATASATTCCRCSPASPSATSFRCWCARRRSCGTTTGSSTRWPDALDPTDALAVAASRSGAGPPRPPPLDRRRRLSTGPRHARTGDGGRPRRHEGLRAGRRPPPGTSPTAPGDRRPTTEHPRQPSSNLDKRYGQSVG